MEAKKKITKASKRRLMIFGTISCFIMGYLLVNLVTYSYQIKKLSDEQARLTQDLKKLKENESDLKNEIDKLKDPDYLARFARENYLYTKNGEYVIKMDQKDSDMKKEKVKNVFGEYKIYIIAGTVILVVMILYILKTLVKENKANKSSKK